MLSHVQTLNNFQLLAVHFGKMQFFCTLLSRLISLFSYNKAGIYVCLLVRCTVVGSKIHATLRFFDYDDDGGTLNDMHVYIASAHLSNNNN